MCLNIAVYSSRSGIYIQDHETRIRWFDNDFMNDCTQAQNVLHGYRDRPRPQRESACLKLAYRITPEINDKRHTAAFSSWSMETFQGLIELEEVSQSEKLHRIIFFELPREPAIHMNPPNCSEVGVFTSEFSVAWIETL